MNNTLKQFILLGVGAFHLTREKIQDLVDNLEAEGALDKAEGEKLVKELMQKSEERAGEVSKQVKAEVARVIKELGLNKKGTKAKPKVSPAKKSKKAKAAS